MSDKITVAEVAFFLDNYVEMLERLLKYVGIAEGQLTLCSKISIEAWLDWFTGAIPLEIKEQLREVDKFAFHLKGFRFLDWNVSSDDLIEMRQKIRELIGWFRCEYPEAGMWVPPGVTSL